MAYPMSSRASRVREKWREKVWVHVKAPAAFGEKMIGYIPITDEQKSIGRVIEITLYDLTKEDPTHYQTKLFFQIIGFDDGYARTVFKGHEYAREYLRSLVRRGSSMINFIKNYQTRDGVTVRVYVVVFTRDRINSSRKTAIRLVADRVLAERVPTLSYDQFAQEAVLGKLASDIYNEAKRICPLRHVGVRKTKLVRMPDRPGVEGEVVVEALGGSRPTPS
jgi:small subunit ribosomal protein S3Ae